MRRSLVIVGTAAVAAVVAPAPAAGQGSAVMTHGSCATAMGAAGVAAPCDDGSAILFNPAALAGQPGVVTAGVTGINTGGSFTYDFSRTRVERERKTVPVPFGYVSLPFGGRFAAGIGVFAPYGLGVDWPVCSIEDPRGCETNFEGRFVSYDTEQRNIFIQPTISMQVAPWLSLGAGVDFVRTTLEINQRGDFSEQTVPNQPFTFGNLGIPRGTDFVDANLAGEGSGITFNLGAQARLSELLSVGVRYLHETEVDLEGDADFTQVQTGLTLAPGNPLGLPAGTPVDALVQNNFATGGPLADQGLSTSLTLPAQFVVGVAVTPSERLKLLVDYQWTGWSSFDVANIDFAEAGRDADLILDYQNTNTFRAGAELMATDRLALRGGFIYNTEAERAASVTPLLPENERNYYSAGIGYRLPRGLSLDLGYQYIDQADRRGRVRGRTSLDQTAEQLNTGVYSINAHVVNATFSYRFGGGRN